VYLIQEPYNNVLRYHERGHRGQSEKAKVSTSCTPRTFKSPGRTEPTLLAGPHPASDNNNLEHTGFSGSLVIAEFDSMDQAQAWADADPYVTNGVYQKVTVKPFKKVLPNISP